MIGVVSGPAVKEMCVERGSLGVTFHVRRVAPEDAVRLRCVRLAALADAPGSFWQTLSAEKARPAADWTARALRNAAGDAHATFLLERDSHLVGMVDVHRPSLAPEFRELAAMWVAPAHRGAGAADTLLDAAVGWARTVGAIGVRLWVVPTNTAAVRLYARHGFALVDAPLDSGYVPMLLTLDNHEAASPTFLTRAMAPWTDESC
jgi:GNAT superfamily N-acetyltransferase